MGVTVGDVLHANRVIFTSASFTHISYIAPFVGRVVALVLKGNNYKCVLFDDGEKIDPR